MHDIVERLLGPEERGFYRLFLEPGDRRDETFTMRLVPDRSQNAQGPTPRITVHTFSHLTAVLTTLRVDGYSQKVGQDPRGIPIFETVSATVPKIIEYLRAASDRADQRMSLIALNTTPPMMESRIEALRTIEEVDVRFVGGTDQRVS